MGIVQPSVFGKSLLPGKFQKAPVYLIYGAGSERVAETAGKLKNAIGRVEGGENFFRYLRIGPGQDEVTPGEIVAQLNTVSMFGGGKLVLIGPLDKIVKRTASLFIDYVVNPNRDATLIITVALAKDNNRALTDFDKTPLAKAVAKSGVVVRFGPVRMADAKKFVTERFRAAGKTIDRSALDRLIELTDKDLGRVTGEIDKLLAYSGESKDVSMDDVEAQVGDHKSDKVWDLTDSVRTRDFRKALATLENLLENNQPAQMILKVLMGEMARLAVALSYRKRGEGFESFLSAMGGPAFPLKKAWADSGKWGADQVQDMTRNILRAYIDIMRAGAEPATALYRMLSETAE